MNNRFFAGRQISASVQKSGLDEYQAANADTEETEEEEQRRLERFAQWLESGGTQQSTTTNVSLAAVEKSSNDEPAGHRDGGFLVPAAPLKAPKRLIDGKIKDLEQEESYFDAE
jgi:hypothetical protein